MGEFRSGISPRCAHLSNTCVKHLYINFRVSFLICTIFALTCSTSTLAMHKEKFQIYGCYHIWLLLICTCKEERVDVSYSIANVKLISRHFSTMVVILKKSALCGFIVTSYIRVFTITRFEKRQNSVSLLF